jgi:hypothetical protein
LTVGDRAALQVARSALAERRKWMAGEVFASTRAGGVRGLSRPKTDERGRSDCGEFTPRKRIPLDGTIP